VRICVHAEFGVIQINESINHVFPQQTPAELIDQPLETLVAYLIDEASTELQRVRVIYRWITAQDLSNLHTGHSVNNSLLTARDYLTGIKNKTVSYHKLMVDMCR
jgi:hypothetical protein